MDTREAYDVWSEQYDTNNNKTRDLEAIAIRATLADVPFDTCLEIGCGTGKNTAWLVTKAKQITAVDLSGEMLARAKQKVRSATVRFHQADITQDWTFANGKFDLVSFSLVLEHIHNLNDVFRKVSDVLISGGFVYIGELHPFKQYAGSKARFDTAAGRQTLTCYTHHISDFTQSASRHGLEVVEINEYFDADDKTTIPRIITLLLKKSSARAKTELAI